MNPVENPNEVIPLWPEGAIKIEDSGWSEEETVLPNGLSVVRNVTRPSLTVFLPDPALANGAAMVVAPGGAFHFMAYDHEGIRVAQWLNARGVAAFVLRYRVYPTGDDFPECVEKNLSDPAIMEIIDRDIYPKILADGCQAVRLVRSRAAEWKLDPHKIGIMGFSAGGVVTGMVARQYDAGSRPDFAAPIYPAPLPPAPIPADAPPLFLLCADDDLMASNASIQIYSDWKAAGRPVELHIYASGGHGFGMNPQGMPSDAWIERMAEWLESLLSAPRA